MRLGVSDPHSRDMLGDGPKGFNLAGRVRCHAANAVADGVGSMRARLGDLLSRLLPRVAPNHAAEREAEVSLLFPPYRGPGGPSDFLLDLAQRGIEAARHVDLTDLDQRWSAKAVEGRFLSDLKPSRWPGEHYRLLAALVQSMKPRHVVEIGTGGGLSALAMKKYLPPGSDLVTFDVIPWNAGRPFEVLQASDFVPGTLVQMLGDLSDPAIFAQHKDIVRTADLVFVDGPKDGDMEKRLLARFEENPFDARPTLVVLDDIRLWTMLGLWSAIQRPKLDLTSFGHWTGTGLVEWA